ncbi:uncharacterized protein LOC131057906 isoform X3 [Cryptomeria japonica]|uniref:uncharacterized protein LOC131057906 isoform X3 n=1 Tax=Cryptomeria japonica TaxID=3369 RepID=UPI0027DA8E8D|nr:uncharacterized protein LOC131057906 isoform X3 [Cryptomeria japonica]
MRNLESLVTPESQKKGIFRGVINFLECIIEEVTEDGTSDSPAPAKSSSKDSKKANGAHAVAGTSSVSVGLCDSRPGSAAGDKGKDPSEPSSAVKRVDFDDPSIA